MRAKATFYAAGAFTIEVVVMRTPPRRSGRDRIAEHVEWTSTASPRTLEAEPSGRAGRKVTFRFAGGRRREPRPSAGG